MTSVNLMVVVGVVAGGVSFMKNLKHLLSVLISLEFLVLMVFFMFIARVHGESLYMPLVFLIFSVCEGALGLTILVAMVRGFGGDYLNMFTLNQ
uniref:NADH-ubiquinone oxidoreductase chain 4L n=1 Tax=Pseudachorutes palmiensis TaxID=187685 RepID=A0A650BKI8_9HEXA|nr:NADH dehydrogenase subunit 4L [Pseudachorutes palmiensis]